MACGIANHFLDKGTSVQALSLKKLLFELRISFGQDLFKKKLVTLNKIDLILISDWQLTTLQLEDIPLLALFIESRKCPLLTTSHLTRSEWKEDLALSKLPSSIKEMITEHSRIWQVNESFKQKLH
jgi:DNA replication protein DnaC